MASPARAAARWTLPNPDSSLVETLRQSLGVNRVVAAVLVHRGYAEPAAARIISGDRHRPLENPDPIDRRCDHRRGS